MKQNAHGTRDGAWPLTIGRVAEEGEIIDGGLVSSDTGGIHVKECKRRVTYLREQLVCLERANEHHRCGFAWGLFGGREDPLDIPKEVVHTRFDPLFG